MTKRYTIFLKYQPPFNWRESLSFLAFRKVNGLEQVTPTTYRRSISVGANIGLMELDFRDADNSHAVALSIVLTAEQHDQQNQDKQSTSDYIVNNVRRMFDLDADSETIDTSLMSVLKPAQGPDFPYIKGLRIAGTWSAYEAGVRAILGQQVTVKQSIKLLSLFVSELGASIDTGQLRNSDTAFEPFQYVFPEPAVVADSALEFLKMPGARKDCLRAFSQYMAALNKEEKGTQFSTQDCNDWLAIKGIGAWTRDYSRIRGLGESDVFLSGDAVVKNALSKLAQYSGLIDTNAAKPWRSYLNLQLWRSES